MLMSKRTHISITVVDDEGRTDTASVDCDAYVIGCIDNHDMTEDGRHGVHAFASGNDIMEIIESYILIGENMRNILLHQEGSNDER